MNGGFQPSLTGLSGKDDYEGVVETMPLPTHALGRMRSRWRCRNDFAERSAEGQDIATAPTRRRDTCNRPVNQRLYTP